MGYKKVFLLLLFLPKTAFPVTLFTTMNETTTSTTTWIVRSNVRYAHQFVAGGAATITSVLFQLSAAQEYHASTSIVIYADSSNTVGSSLGTLTYSSFDNSTKVVTYTGSISIPSAGTYWIEIKPTADIANHYYTGTSSTSATGSASDWAQRKNYVASGSDSVSWSYFVGTPFNYPKFALIGTAAPTTQTITTLVAAVNVAASPYLVGTTLDFSGATLTTAGQSTLDELTGLDESLDGLTKASITTLKLGGNTNLTTIPANIFSTFPNLQTLELHGNTGLTTITANAFNGLTVSTLRLDGNTSLTSIPANAFNGLTINSELKLENTGLTTITANAFNGLSVTGTVKLNSNSSLTTLPANAFNGMNITGKLQINSNTALTTISADAFDGLTLTGCLELNDNTRMTTLANKIYTRFFSIVSVTGDVRLDSTGLTSLHSQAFSSSVISNDLRIDNNNSLTTVPATALQKTHVGNDLKINNTGITKLMNETFKDTQVGNDLSLNANSSLSQIEPLAFHNLKVTGNIDLENTPNLSKIPWCAFDAASINGVIKMNNSGLIAALPDGPDKTKLMAGATQEEIKKILRRNPLIAQPVSREEYAQVLKLKGKNLALYSAPR